MGRVVGAFVLAPLLVSFAYGPVFFIAYPLFLIVTVALGVPAFFLFRRLGWLRWWHAVLFGVAGSTLGSYFDMGGNAVRAEIYGPPHMLGFVLMGAGVGLLFWWLGLFRNDRYPGVASSVPKSMWLVLAAGLLAWMAMQRVDVFDVRARLQGAGGGPPADTVAKATARMVLPSGESIEVLVLDDKPLPPAGTCAYLLGRRVSLVSEERRYWVLHFMDEHFNDYDKC